MSGPEPFPGAAPPPIDSDDDDVVDVANDLPDDIPNDDLTLDEPPVAIGPVADTNVDVEVEGTPLTDDEIGV